MKIFDDIIDWKIARNNFNLMFGKKSLLDGGMIYLLRRESIGGNAGFSKDKKYSRAGANFYFNKDTGEIIEFSNKPRNDFAHGTFLILADFNKKYMFFFIERAIFISEISSRAKANIQKSINIYNTYLDKINVINQQV